MIVYDLSISQNRYIEHTDERGEKNGEKRIVGDNRGI